MAQIIRLRNIKRALSLTAEHVKKSDDTYVISGRVGELRSYRSFNFVDLIDGSTREHLQVVLDKSLLRKPQIGSYVTCVGKLVPSPGAKQPIEFKVDKVEFVSPCDPDEYILAKTKEQMTDNLYRKYVHLRPRVGRFMSLLRVRSELELSLHMILKQMDFFRVHTPTLTSNDSEASSDLFLVQRSKLESQETRVHNKNRAEDESYFDKDVFLVTSAQLHLECLAASLSRVYTLGPCFRAEKSISQRHLCEFQMLEAEEANVTQLDTLMERVESIIKFSAQFLSNVSEHNQDFSHLVDHYANKENLDKLTNSNYVRMTYKEALDVLRAECNPELPTNYGCDISRKHEKRLLKYCNNVPIFITCYPKGLKPFYVRSNRNDEQEVDCFDLIAPIGGEICGGSLREDDLERLKSNMKIEFPPSEPGARVINQVNRNADSEANESADRQLLEGVELGRQVGDFNWYADLRRFGTFPHGGFGIGFERLILALTGINNIKDSTAFPRWSGHCYM